MMKFTLFGTLFCLMLLCACSQEKKGCTDCYASNYDLNATWGSHKKECIYPADQYVGRYSGTAQYVFNGTFTNPIYTNYPIEVELSKIDNIHILWKSVNDSAVYAVSAKGGSGTSKQYRERELGYQKDSILFYNQNPFFHTGSTESGYLFKIQ
jgi:hypothetical protein